MNGRSRVVLVAVFVALAWACKKDTPQSTRWDDAAAAVAAGGAGASPPTTVTITPPGLAPSARAPSGSLNRYFPKDGQGGYTRIFAADKEGYAEAKLQKGGKEVAILSIADAGQLAIAKAKFESATENVAGYPLVKVGQNQSSVLVKDRFQVKVSSPVLDHAARKAILETFDLKGLGT